MAPLDAGQVASLGTVLTGLVVAVWAGRKARAEAATQDATAAEMVTRSALALVEPLRDQVARLVAAQAHTDAELLSLRAEVAALRAENIALTLGVQRLQHQVRSLGQVPVFGHESP